MSQTHTPFLKWGQYMSKSEKNPDTLLVKVTETNISKSEYSENVPAIVDGEEKIIPLHSFESANKGLLKLWLKAKNDGKLVVGTTFKILTWIGTSKKNKNRPIRRFRFKF
ncbi:hypothetical protein [Nitrosopumilus adriaticus]|uniref:Uncharacterized protein n=1 Tax=Nitrosopumilus adriaticus TaxID=1580092 RepID=A0A0D5C3A4_9ARCH|nr:hypothetical protein [Nitrosopumilus adriaticus]AJW71038.1 hypothetical protein NADRNF5_1352 [Nitrosopumilus adriaticus]